MKFSEQREHCQVENTAVCGGLWFALWTCLVLQMLVFVKKLFLDGSRLSSAHQGGEKEHHQC